ncbi:hypothetical protein [Aeromonas diversa]|uniref:hypothetical protein n=1 Tax=Aeromonas diversa TaxID=502790 RepID=UPI0034626297
MAEVTYLPDLVAAWAMVRGRVTRQQICRQFALDAERWNYVLCVFRASPRYQYQYTDGELLVRGFEARPQKVVSRVLPRSERGKPRPVMATELASAKTYLFSSLQEAEQEGFHRGGILQALRREPSHYAGYAWRAV